MFWFVGFVLIVWAVWVVVVLFGVWDGLGLVVWFMVCLVWLGLGGVGGWFGGVLFWVLVLGLIWWCVMIVWIVCLCVCLICLLHDV